MRAAEGARHAAETPIGSDTEAERVAGIEGSRSQGEDEKLTSSTEHADVRVDYRKSGQLGERKAMIRVTVPCMIIVALVLTLSGCSSSLVDNFLCRPNAHCIDAPDRNVSSE